jgi:hypothetical protein
LKLALKAEPLIAARAKERMISGVKANPTANLPEGTSETRDELAELALKAEPLIAARAKERQLSTLKQNTDVANLPPRDETGKTRDEIAALAKVS